MEFDLGDIDPASAEVDDWFTPIEIERAGEAPPPPSRRPRRRRRRKITKELVRCTYRDPRTGATCGSLVWIRELDQHATAHGPGVVAEDIYIDPRDRRRG